MVRTINSITDMKKIISLMKFTEEENGEIPEHVLQDIKKAYQNTRYGVRLKMLENIQKEKTLIKYYNYIIESNIEK